jgi:hypothetical protein
MFESGCSIPSSQKMREPSREMASGSLPATIPAGNRATENRARGSPN